WRCVVVGHRLYQSARQRARAARQPPSQRRDVFAAASRLRADGNGARHGHARETMSDAMRRQARSGAVYTSSTKFFRLLLQSSALGLGVLLALEQQISAGAIVAASILASRAFQPIELIVGAWTQFEQGRQAYGVLKAVLK